MNTKNVDIPRARVRNGADKRRVQMSLMPAERNELDEMARVNGMGDSAFAAMVYRKGLAALKAEQCAA